MRDSVIRIALLACGFLPVFIFFYYGKTVNGAEQLELYQQLAQICGILFAVVSIVTTAIHKDEIQEVLMAKCLPKTNELRNKAIEIIFPILLTLACFIVSITAVVAIPLFTVIEIESYTKSNLKGLSFAVVYGIYVLLMISMIKLFMPMLKNLSMIISHGRILKSNK